MLRESYEPRMRSYIDKTSLVEHLLSTDGEFTRGRIAVFAYLFARENLLLLGRYFSQNIEKLFVHKRSLIFTDYLLIIESTLMSSYGSVAAPSTFTFTRLSFFTLAATIPLLENQHDEQAQRRDELQTRSIYVTTKQFIEEFAREKLGLVYEDELIFRPQDK